MAKLSKGTCYLCGKSFSKSGIARHLVSCRGKGSEGQNQVVSHSRAGRKGFHLAVEGRYRPDYWMHLEITGSETLAGLDYFLRYVWLECCGHLSAFKIGSTYYYLEDMEEFAQMEDRNMEVPLSRVIRPGLKFVHEYDFGSTTELALRVVSESNVAAGSEAIRLLARNEPPALSCFGCGASSSQICTECNWNGEGFYCDECAGLHVVQSPSCDEMFLPVVNSPRTGECGYTGEDAEDWSG